MKYAFTLLLCSLSLLMASCRNITLGDSSKTKSFNSLYSNCSMNSEVVMLPLSPYDKNEDTFTVNYHNVSKSEVAFLIDSGLKIYAFDPEKESWTEIKNSLNYAKQREAYKILYPSDDLTGYGSMIFTPDFSNEIPKEIRVAITGYLYKDGAITDNCVGAFIDLVP
jgi:hypothetical protein